MARAEDSGLLRQVFIRRAGHCAFTPAETITAVGVLLNRLATGKWDTSALVPATMNAQAKALGPNDNIYYNGKGGLAYTASEYLSYQPAPFLRPFDLDPDSASLASQTAGA